MTKKTFIILVSALLIIYGCETTGARTKEGAVGGAAVGGIAGGIIGHQSGHGLEGAAIGAGLGALAGAALGSAAEQREREAKATNPSHLPITRIAEMAEQGVPDAAIIDEIRITKSVYHLDSQTITYLRQHKVSDRVIDYMMATG